MKSKSLKDFPKVIREWDYEKNGSTNPLNIASRSNKKYWFKCPLGHSYQATPDNKTSRNAGCPICSNRVVVSGINDFKTNNPQKMLDWDYVKNTIDPSKVPSTSAKHAFWKCHKCGHLWNSEIREAASKEINCPKCSLVQKGKAKHLQALTKSGHLTNEELLLDWNFSKNNLRPEDVTPQTNIAVYWKCHRCGYEWKAKVNNRTNGRGCPCCGNKVVVKGINDLATTHPVLAKEWHPTKNGDLKPTDVTYGMSKKVWWLCPNGHEYKTSLNHRSAAIGTNCPICNSGKQTSFREQALFYYIKKMYPNTISRYKPTELGKFEIDIYIPELNFGIEYDGVAWHKEEKFDREKRKYILCKKLGITLIRVKEKMPDELGLEIADEIYSSGDLETEQGITLIIHRILERLDFSDFYRLHPLDVNLSRDRFEIMKYATRIKDSFADAYPEIAKEWHPTKNGDLKPSMFKPKSSFKPWWLCPDCGHEYEAPLCRRATGTSCIKCGVKKSAIKRTKSI